MSLQQHKCAEAAAQLKQADKALAKRSFFRGAPDYLTAAPLLDKAGELFRLGGDFEAAKQAFARCADAQQHNQSAFRAAQAWENVAKTALQQLKAERSGAHSAQQRTAEARKAYETASSLYVDMGELGKAADALVKGAQACEAHGSAVDDVLPLYFRACELLEAQDKPHFAVETFRKTMSFLAKHGKYSDAVKLLDRLTALYEAMDQPHNVHKTHLSQIVLLLATGDVPAADALYSCCLQDDAFLTSDDCALAEDLVRAFKMGNEDLLQATVRKPGFMALDNQIGRICRKLSVYGAGEAAPPPPQHRPAPSSATRSPRRHAPPLPSATRSRRLQELRLRTRTRRRWSLSTTLRCPRRRPRPARTCATATTTRRWRQRSVRSASPARRRSPPLPSHTPSRKQRPGRSRNRRRPTCRLRWSPLRRQQQRAPACAWTTGWTTSSSPCRTRSSSP